VKIITNIQTKLTFLFSTPTMSYYNRFIYFSDAFK